MDSCQTGMSYTNKDIINLATQAGLACTIETTDPSEIADQDLREHWKAAHEILEQIRIQLFSKEQIERDQPTPPYPETELPETDRRIYD